MVFDDAMEVHLGLRLLDRVADHACCHHYSRELRHLQCWSSSCSNTQNCIREVNEARLCGSSLPTGSIALPALGRNQQGLKNPT